MSISLGMRSELRRAGGAFFAATHFFQPAQRARDGTPAAEVARRGGDLHRNA